VKKGDPRSSDSANRNHAGYWAKVESRKKAEADARLEGTLWTRVKRLVKERWKAIGGTLAILLLAIRFAPAYWPVDIKVQDIAATATDRAVVPFMLVNENKAFVLHELHPFCWLEWVDAEGFAYTVFNGDSDPPDDLPEKQERSFRCKFAENDRSTKLTMAIIPTYWFKLGPCKWLRRRPHVFEWHPEVSRWLPGPRKKFDDFYAGWSQGNPPLPSFSCSSTAADKKAS